MYLKIVLLLGLSYSVHARETKNIQVSLKRVSYKIKINQSSIQYLDQFTDLSLESKKCNEPLFREMKSIIEKYLSHPFPANNNPQNIIFKIDQSVFYELENTNRAQFFLTFLDYMKARKIEEMFSCRAN